MVTIPRTSARQGRITAFVRRRGTVGGQRAARQERLFTAAEPVLLRAPARPVPEHPDAPAGPAEADLAAYVAEAAADPLFREAIEVSSPSLAQVLARDTPPTGDALRRAA